MFHLLTIPSPSALQTDPHNPGNGRRVSHGHPAIPRIRPSRKLREDAEPWSRQLCPYLVWTGIARARRCQRWPGSPAQCRAQLTRYCLQCYRRHCLPSLLRSQALGNEPQISVCPEASPQPTITLIARSPQAPVPRGEEEQRSCFQVCVKQ